MEFIVAHLKKNKDASYAEIKAAADAKKLKVYPIMFGRAQALLGLVKSKPRGQGKAAQAKAMKRGPGRPPKSSTAGIDTSSLDGIIAAVKHSEAAKSRYRSALEKIQTILASALD